jgi:glutamine phosphoribosylpyrophosphate amidotransferase
MIVVKDKKLKNLVEEICNEHHNSSVQQDSNIGYLWYMYVNGSKQGTFKPFMFLAELNLLVATGYVTEDEKQNMLGMMLSQDEDNFNLMAYSILHFRNQRIKDKGLYKSDNEKYSDIDYLTHIFNPELFLK